MTSVTTQKLYCVHWNFNQILLLYSENKSCLIMGNTIHDVSLDTPLCETKGKTDRQLTRQTWHGDGWHLGWHIWEDSWHSQELAVSDE